MAMNWRADVVLHHSAKKVQTNFDQGGERGWFDIFRIIKTDD